MTIKLIFTILSLAIFILSFRSKNKWNIGFTSVLLVCFLVAWIKIPTLITIAAISFVIVSVIACIYVIAKKEYTVIEKVLMALVTLIIFLQIWAKILHLPIYNTSRFLSIIPVILFIILLFGKARRKILRPGFITLLVIYCLMRFIELITWI